MPKIQQIPWVPIAQQSTKSKTSFHASSMMTTRFHQAGYHQNLATPLRLVAPRPQRHKWHHAQNQSLVPKRSEHPTPLTRLATMASASGISSSPTPHVSEPSPMSSEQFHRLSDAYIETLVSKLEALQEEREDVDVEYSAGVLSLVFPPVGTYVLNKQPPNKQIWLSSPLSGPKRYDWVETESKRKVGQWVYLRDGSTLDGLLVEELGINLEDD